MSVSQPVTRHDWTLAEVKALFQHLGVHTRTACVSVARQRGLLG